MNVARLQFLTNEKRQEPIQKSEKTSEFSDVMESFDSTEKTDGDKLQTKPQNNDPQETELERTTSLKKKEIPVKEETLSLEEEQTNEEIMETIASILDLTTEELEELLGQLGFTMTDLANPDCMTKLLLTANQSVHIQEALTNETLSTQLIKLTQLTEQLKQQVKTEGMNVENDSEAVMISQDITSVSTEKTVDVQTEPVEQNKEQKFEVVVEQKEQSNESQQSFQQTEYNLNSFVTQLQQATNEINTETFDANVEMSTIVDQIVEQIKVNLGDGVTSMELTLTPEHLGHVNLMIVSKDGVMTARFYAETEVAKEALESQMQLLKQNFEEQGLKVQEVEVMVSSNPFNSQSGGFGEEGFQQHSEKKKQGQRVQKQEFFDPNEMSDVTEVLLQDTSTMDITA